VGQSPNHLTPICLHSPALWSARVVFVIGSVAELEGRISGLHQIKDDIILSPRPDPDPDLSVKPTLPKDPWAGPIPVPDPEHLPARPQASPGRLLAWADMGAQTQFARIQPKISSSKTHSIYLTTRDFPSLLSW